MSVVATGRPSKRLLGALVLSVGLGASALPGPAQAQFFGWGPWDNGGAPEGLPGPQVRRRIAGQGFRVLGPLRRNGDVFVADVIDRRGRHERLIVGSADAQILQRFYVDDGRGAGVYARGDDPDREALLPPADIPGGARPGADRFGAGRPAPRRFGDLDGDAPDTAVVEPPPLRSQPPIKTVRPRPRVVERTPDAPVGREPAAVESTPLAPAAARPRAVEPPRTAEPARPAPRAPAAVASRPDAPATPTPSAAAPAPAPTSQPRRLSDPLAIPGGPPKADAGSPPVRSVSGGVTGAPAPAAAPAAKPGEVPAAPLD